jgi:PAS domain S-box-containing protein
VCAFSPAAERRRVDALRALGLLDTEPEERFDRLTRLAAASLDVGMCLISLVDEHRQWVKSRLGSDVVEVPIGESMCATALDHGLLIVPDTQLDPRLAAHPKVVGEPHVRFFAGHAIHDPAGVAIGALCVFGAEPRDFGPAQQAILRDLAHLVDDELARGTAAEVLDAARATNERTRDMIDTLAEGLVYQGLDGSILEWNAAAERVLGLTGDELGGRQCVDPRWRAIRADGSPWPGETHPAMEALRTGEPVDAALMGVHQPGGALVWLRVNARPVRDADGEMTGVLAAFYDVTAQVDLERRSAKLTETIRAAVETGAVGMAMLDRQGRAMFVNGSLARILGVSVADATGSQLRDYIHPEDPVQRLFDEMRVGLIDRLSEDVCLRTQLGEEPRWIRLNITLVPLDDDFGALVQVTEITERKRLQAQLARSEEVARVCLDSLDQGVIFASPTLGIHRMNPAAATILGWSAEELFDEWVSPRAPVLDEFCRPMSEVEFPGVRAIFTGEPVKDEIIWMPRKDGAWRRVRFSAVPFGWTDEVVMVFTDITPYTPMTAPTPPLDARWERVDGRLTDVTPRA